MAGENIHIRGECSGFTEGRNEDDPWTPHLPPSFTDLETIDFIPAFAPEKEEEVVFDIHGGAGGGDAEIRPKMQLVRSER